ncbi:MAG TPA: helix-turn-helix domain-containing protein [Baekduia sp.]|uniref:TetR/AcrR family transcriptional regulator n=1 Tax=Baekduia sp. TaxID=2600305 RepID=UPI002D773DC3|nr:helix-turn-helix domain-containing protein [Baekduia sp.]HET6508690.1 helix-turn-helix domain-containing protein [Baekduia sp.]
MVPQFELPMSAPDGHAPAERERADARRNRERILCAAARLIDEKGIDCMSMDDVAHAAGVGKGTLYRRFGDRAALLRALISEPEQEFQDNLIRGLPPLGPGAPAGERLHAFGEHLLRFLDGHAIYVKAGELLGGGKRYAHPVYAFYQTHVSLLLREACGTDAINPYMVDALLAPLAAEPFLYQRDVRGMALDEIVAGWHSLCDCVLSGLGASAADAPDASAA